MPVQPRVPPADANRFQDALFLLNPNSGSVSNPTELAREIRELFPKAEIFVSQKAGDIQEAAFEARTNGREQLVVGGGDGTLNEALNGCMRAGGMSTLGLIPLGTGNDFARALGIPTSLTEALHVVQHGTAKMVDVIRINGKTTRYMINVAAGGFAGLVSESLTPELKASWGPLSYLRGVVDALGELQPYDAQFQIDDEPPQRIRTLNVAVANGSHVARGIPIAPGSNPADGLMDVVILKECSLPVLALLIPEILAGTHLNNAEILHRRARHLVMRSNPTMIFNADGEVIGDGSFEFEVHPAAIAFLAPPC